MLEKSSSVDVLNPSIVHKRKVSEDKSNSQQATPRGMRDISHFHDKRMRRSFSHNNVQDHEDAVTLMGFLSSVRQAAASGASSSKS